MTELLCPYCRKALIMLDDLEACPSGHFTLTVTRKSTRDKITQAKIDEVVTKDTSEKYRFHHSFFPR